MTKYEDPIQPDWDSLKLFPTENGYLFADRHASCGL